VALEEGDYRRRFLAAGRFAFLAGEARLAGGFGREREVPFV